MRIGNSCFGTAAGTAAHGLVPLPYVPVHVVQPEPIRRKRTNRRRRPIVPTTPAYTAIRTVLPNLIPPPVTRPRPRSRHVLPLRFAQQPVLLPCLPRQPFHIRLRIFPTHVNHRTTASAPTCIVRTMPATSAPRYARIPLPKRHLVHPHRKRPPYPHTMHRSFIVISAILRRRRTHLVRPRRHHHQLRTLRAIPELRPKRSCHRPALPQPQQLHTVRVQVGWGPGARGIGEHPRKHPAPPPGSTAASRARQGQRHRCPARRRGHQGPPRQERIVTRNCASPGRP